MSVIAIPSSDKCPVTVAHCLVRLKRFFFPFLLRIRTDQWTFQLYYYSGPEKIDFILNRYTLSSKIYLLTVICRKHVQCNKKRRLAVNYSLYNYALLKLLIYNLSYQIGCIVIIQTFSIHCWNGCILRIPHV